MNGQRKFVLVVLFAIVSLTYWEGCPFAYNEPDNFGGLKFGQDLTKQMKPCPFVSLASGARIADFKKIKASGARCHFGNFENDGHYGLFNMGSIEAEVEDVEADQIDGKLVHVYLGFVPKKTVMFAILEERYGKPTAQWEEPWTAPGSLKVKTTMKRAEWNGRKVSIKFDQVDAVSLGNVDFVTDAWMNYQKSLKAKAQQAESEKIKKQAEEKAERIKKAANGL